MHGPFRLFRAEVGIRTDCVVKETPVLHDHERRALDRIEAEIAATDPTFAERLGRPLTSWRFVLVLVAITGTCALAVGIVADQASLALAGIVTVGVFVVRHLSRRTSGAGG